MCLGTFLGFGNHFLCLGVKAKPATQTPPGHRSAPRRGREGPGNPRPHTLNLSYERGTPVSDSLLITRPASPHSETPSVASQWWSLFPPMMGRSRSSSTPNPQPSPQTLNPQPSTLNPQPSTLNPQPSTLKPQPSTLNPQPSTPNPEP